MKTSPVIFKKSTGEDVSFEDLLRKIYENSEERHQQIIATAEHVTKKIKNPADAMQLMPSLIELQKVAVKNDDQMLNLASIIQRTMQKASKGEDEGFNISAEDRKALLAAAKQAVIPSQSSDE